MEETKPEAAEAAEGEDPVRYRDPILSYPTKAETHDDFRKVCRRGFVLGSGQRKVRDGQVRGKAAVKEAKRHRRSVREIRADIAENGL